MRISHRELNPPPQKKYFIDTLSDYEKSTRTFYSSAFS